MRFTLTVTDSRPDALTEKAEITFKASNWEAAGKTAARLQRDLGMDGPSFSSIVAYTEKTAEEAKAIQVRREVQELSRRSMQEHIARETRPGGMLHGMSRTAEGQRRD